MKTRTAATLSFVSAIVLLGSAPVFSQDRSALPPNNPFLIQNSVYPSAHFDSAQTDTTTLPVWLGDSTIEPSQVDWLPGFTHIGAGHRPYPGGEQAVFFSGGGGVGKIRITDGDFSMVDEVSIPGLEDDTISTTRLRRIVKQIESANRDEKDYLPPLTKFLEKTSQSTTTLSNGVYSMMDRDGYYYAGWGTSVYKVGDVREDDVYSPIEIVASYDLRSGLLSRKGQPLWGAGYERQQVRVDGYDRVWVLPSGAERE